MAYWALSQQQDGVRSIASKERRLPMTAFPPPASVTLSVAHCLDELDREPTRRAHTAYIVVDVIRATTTLAVMCERGVRRVYVAPDVETARRLRASLPDALLAGEVDAVPPPGFDHGNSPAEWGALAVAGRDVLFSTTNGARGLHAALGGGPVFAGSLRNASAVSAAALAAARSLATAEHTGRVCVVCSGLGDKPAPDDSLCAGWLIQTLQGVAERAGVGATLGAGAGQALELLAEQRAAWSGAAADERAWLAEALAATPAARAVLAAGLGADIAWCAAVDASPAVPRVTGEDAARSLVIVEQAR